EPELEDEVLRPLAVDVRGEPRLRLVAPGLEPAHRAWAGRPGGAVLGHAGAPIEDCPEGPVGAVVSGAPGVASVVDVPGRTRSVVRRANSAQRCACAVHVARPASVSS